MLTDRDAAARAAVPKICARRVSERPASLFSAGLNSPVSVRS
jgi:hypothetical protein